MAGVADLYREILGREPEAEGLAYWQEMFGSSIDPAERQAFQNAANVELAQRAAAQPAPAVTQRDIIDAYRQTVGSGTMTEAEFVRQAQERGVTSDQLISARSALLNTAPPPPPPPPPSSRDAITDLYRQILGRDPEAEGLSYWEQQFGPTVEPGEIEAFRRAAQVEIDQRNRKPSITRPPAPPPAVGAPTGVTTTPIDPSQSTLSPNFADYVYRMLAKGEQVANLPYQPYTGQRYAGVSPLQLQAFSGIANLADPAAFAEAQRFMTMAGTNAGNTFYTPTSFTTGLSPAPAGTTPPVGIAALPMGGAARNVNLPTVQDVVSRFGATPGWNTQTPSTAIPTGQTLEGRFPEAEQTFADGGLASLATPQQNPFQLGDVASYMNPYITNVTDIAAREARRQADIGRTAEQARLSQAGAYGGSRQAIMEAERQRNLQTQMGDIATTGLQSAYDRAMEQRLKESGLGLEAQKLGEQSRQFGAEFGLKGQQAQLQAGLGLGQLGVQQGQFGLDALKTMLGAGQTQQQLAQQPYDFGYQQWQESMKYPYQQATFMSSLLGGLPVTAAPYNTGTSGLSGLMQALGLAMGGYKALGG